MSEPECAGSYRAESIVVGVGATAAATGSDIAAGFASVVRPHWTVVAVATLDRKHSAVESFARSLSVPLTKWTAAQLASVVVPAPSLLVDDAVGTPSVAEAAAVLASGGGALILGKTKVGPVTVAVATAAVPEEEDALRA
ncbi:cobalamin biosynthesis protein [Rhodococcus sp. PAMC28707]|uniref:cobalamin biosynthesis protein n=1 Tax=unclassified Rhodococcus (in: high G+C Gram-positive bacteria) TaxID=192944 RepID=UPI00109DA2AC|nr:MULTISPECIES: cobalamin biosynthesis protein [unclassified Rhodococcus (in: high G+C Gram-positive bacteria)]QCB50860.1 cobalamin biosynthesis protein [Rhodococcus sp. PAMC28705]QCB57449.1 cobalamin biosynthesis protein [Rhodococcus sp. PAMC28707]